MGVLLRVLGAAALAVVAYVHLDIAPSYTSIGDPSLGATFRVQSVVALVLAVALLVRPRALVLTAVAVFSAASLAALVWSRYRCLYVPGFDSCYRETWETDGAQLSAVAEAVALLAALAQAPGRRRTRVSAG